MKKYSYKNLYLLLVGICILVYNSSAGQNSKSFDENIKEYNHQIQNSKVDTIIAKAYYNLAVLYSQSNSDTVIPLCNQSIRILKTRLSNIPNSTEKKNLEFLIAENNYMIAYVYYLKGDIKKAIQYNEQALYLYSGTNKNSKVAKVFNNLGVIYSNIGIYKKALEYNLKSLDIYKSHSDQHDLALVYNNIGNNYFLLENYQKSKEHILKGLEINKKINSHKGIAQSYNSLGSLAKKQNDTLLAIKNYKKSLEICFQNDNNKGIAVALNNIGITLKEQLKNDSAIFNLKKALIYLKKIKHQFGLANTLGNLGKIYLEINDFENAELYLNQALDISVKNNYTKNIEKVASSLSELNKIKNNWKKAYEMISLFYEMQSKVIENSQEKENIKNEIIFDEKRKYEKQQLEQDKQLAIAKEKDKNKNNAILFISIGLVITLIFLFIIYHRLKISNRQKIVIKKQNKEQKVLLQEIHHRVKNNFQIISSLLKLQSIQEENTAIKDSFEEAINRISSMALVHDLIYRQDQYAEIKTNDYLQKLVKNIKQSIASNTIDIHWKRIEAKDLNIQTLLPLGIIINELITNAVKHAFENNDAKSIIEFELLQKENSFFLTYKDNGKGYPQLDANNSFGIDLIKTILIQLDGELKVTTLDNWNTSMSITFKEQ